MNCPKCGYHSVTKLRQASLKTHKYAQCFKNHDEHCYCVDCAPARLNGAISQMKSIARDHDPSIKALAKFDHANDLVYKDGAWKSPGFDRAEERARLIAKLEHCACGHLASNHVADELENLLGCKYESEGGTPCGCDHFHYEISEEIAA
jgi:hypothetical protein